jgi:hypothetical protein
MGLDGWTYRSNQPLASGTLVEIPLRKQHVFGMIAWQILDEDTTIIYSDIERAYDGVILMSEQKIQVLTSLALEYAMPISKIFALFYTKETLTALAHHKPQSKPFVHHSVFEPGSGEIYITKNIAAFLKDEWVHSFPYDRLDVLWIESDVTIISSQSTQKERRTVWIESLLGERSSLYGTRDVLRYPVEHYSQITYYLPHIQGEWYHMLHHYRILDFLEAMRVYLGIRVRIIAPRLSSELVGLYHLRQYQLLEGHTWNL